MRHETAIAAAFKRADASTSHMQAYSLAAKLLRAAGGKHDAVPLALKKFLDAISADEDLLRGCALGFLQFVAGDMKGGATGQSSFDTQARGASAPPPDRDGTSHSGYAAQASTARPVREPSTSQKEAAGSVRRLMAESVLQTFKVRDGRAIAKVWRSEISDMIGTNWRENAILDRVRNIKPPDGANDARIGDYVTDAQMRRIMTEVDRAAA
jgi:hypothetical protein